MHRPSVLTKGSKVLGLISKELRAARPTHRPPRHGGLHGWRGAWRRGTEPLASGQHPQQRWVPPISCHLQPSLPATPADPPTPSCWSLGEEPQPPDRFGRVLLCLPRPPPAVQPAQMPRINEGGGGTGSCVNPAAVKGVAAYTVPLSHREGRGRGEAREICCRRRTDSTVRPPSPGSTSSR
jgi:hypothetical protein